MALLSMNTGNRVHSIRDRKDDLYQTPAVAVRVLLRVEDVPSMVWEPCCGPGSIVSELRSTGRSVVAHDLVDWGCPDSEARRDFLMERSPAATCIVTNPPFKLAEEFVEHAIGLCPEVYMLLRVAFLEGLRWERSLAPHLARVHVFAPRLPMMHREGWDGPVNSNSGIAFGWFAFQRNWARKGGLPTVAWVNWKTMPGIAESLCASPPTNQQESTDGESRSKAREDRDQVQAEDAGAGKEARRQGQEVTA